MHGRHQNLIGDPLNSFMISVVCSSDFSVLLCIVMYLNRPRFYSYLSLVPLCTEHIVEVWKLERLLLARSIQASSEGPL